MPICIDLVLVQRKLVPFIRHALISLVIVLVCAYCITRQWSDVVRGRRWPSTRITMASPRLLHSTSSSTTCSRPARARNFMVKRHTMYNSLCEFLTGTEPLSFYLINLVLNFNVVAIATAVLLPTSVRACVLCFDASHRECSLCLSLCKADCGRWRWQHVRENLKMIKTSYSFITLQRRCWSGLRCSSHRHTRRSGVSVSSERHLHVTSLLPDSFFRCILHCA